MCVALCVYEHTSASSCLFPGLSRPRLILQALCQVGVTTGILQDRTSELPKHLLHVYFHIENGKDSLFGPRPILTSADGFQGRSVDNT